MSKTLIGLAFMIQAATTVPSRPAPPTKCSVGDTMEIEYDDISKRIDIALIPSVLEPITILAESYDADIVIEIADITGNIIGRDDDSGTETNACLTWTPRSTSSHYLHIWTHDSQPASILVFVLRGAIDPHPVDPLLATQAYWDRAYDRARRSENSARQDLAIERMFSIRQRQDNTNARETLLSRDAIIDSSRDSLKSARRLERENHPTEARHVLRKTLEAISRIPNNTDDALAADLAQGVAAESYQLGDSLITRDACDRTCSFFERTLPADHIFLQKARGNLAAADQELGDTHGARLLEEKVLESYERTLPINHQLIQIARINLAMTLFDLGELTRVRTLQMRALESLESTSAPNDSLLQTARMKLGITMGALGDNVGARALQERALVIAEQTLSENDPTLQGHRLTLAVTLVELGDLTGARTLFELALPALEETLGENHPTVLAGQVAFSEVLHKLNETQRAMELLEAALAKLESVLPEEHPAVQEARLDLAALLSDVGDRTRAHDLEKRVLAVVEKSLPADFPSVQSARINVLATDIQMGELKNARFILERLTSGSQRQLSRSRLLSSREASQLANSLNPALSHILSWYRLMSSPDELHQATYRLVEERRLAVAAENPSRDENFAIESASSSRRELIEANRRLSDITTAFQSLSPISRPTSAEITNAALARDRAESTYRAELAKHGAAPQEVSVEAVQRALPDKACAVCFVRYKKLSVRDDDARTIDERDSLMAYVVTVGGGLRTVDLGGAEDVSRAVVRWRSAIGKSIGVEASPDRARALSVTEQRDAGIALRSLVFDPVLAVAGDAKTVYVCLDGPLHLVPLDALPLGEGVVGDHVSIRLELSLARLLRHNQQRISHTRLLAVGGADYDASLPDFPIPPPAGATSAPKDAQVRGVMSGQRFPILSGALAEVQSIDKLFSGISGATSNILTGAQATKSAFSKLASDATVIHVATHGYFSDVTDKHVEHGGQIPKWSALSGEQAVRSMSPLGLCGLAFAGANNGLNATAQSPGILTGEELAGMDLRKVDLVVLSACETHVGPDRGAAGIMSLQAAIHTAGAHTAITSLWKVQDTKAKEFMERFYRRLWLQGKSKAVALWEAKTSAREDAWRESDWAGWVLSGDGGDEESFDPAKASQSRR